MGIKAMFCLLGHSEKWKHTKKYIQSENSPDGIFLTETKQLVCCRCDKQISEPEVVKRKHFNKHSIRAKLNDDFDQTGPQLVETWWNEMVS